MDGMPVMQGAFVLFIGGNISLLMANIKGWIK